MHRRCTRSTCASHSRVALFNKFVRIPGVKHLAYRSNHAQNSQVPRHGVLVLLEKTIAIEAKVQSFWSNNKLLASVINKKSVCIEDLRVGDDRFVQQNIFFLSAVTLKKTSK